jgi:1,6-anhydro-N-acetylmuramate kinase
MTGAMTACGLMSGTSLDAVDAAIRLVNAPIMKRTMRSGRSMKPTLHLSMRLSARARA